MRLILSREDSRKDGVVVYSIPNLDLSEEIQDNMKKMHQRFKDRDVGDETIFFSEGGYFSGFFKIPSAWFPEQEEKLLLTLYVQEHENTTFFEPILRHTINKLKREPDLSRALYISTPHANQSSFKKFGKMIKILTEAFFEAAKKHETYNLGLAELLILGTKGGGKSTIVDYLIHGRFIPQKQPTLTPKVLNLLYKNMDFRVLDVCCNDHVKEVLNDHPLEPGKLPQAIVYVVDATLDGMRLRESIREFKNWMKFLSRKYPSGKFSNIPILVLFNKIDRVQDFNLEKFENLYDPTPYGTSAHYDGISAKEGFGINDNFEWLLNSISVSVKY